MFGVPAPVEGRFDNAPEHLIICSPRYATSDHSCRYGDRSEEREEEAAIQKEIRRQEATEREEARLEARRKVSLEKKRQLAREKAASDQISRDRQIERRKREAVSLQEKPRLTDEERKAKKQAYNRLYIEKQRLRKKGLPENARQKTLAAVPQGWMNLADAARASGVADSTSSKYRALGLIHGIKTPFGVFVDPNELIAVFQSRQKAHKNYLQDQMHKIMKARYPFCETVDQ